MHWYQLFWAVPVAAGIIAVSTIPPLWPRRKTPEVRTLILGMVAVAEWSLAYAVELASTDLAGKIFWAKAQYPGVVAIAPLFLTLALQYSERYPWLKRRHLALLWLAPLAALGLALTNQAHHLMWVDFRLDSSGPFAVLDIKRGMGYWLLIVAYSYLLVFLGFLLLVLEFLRLRRLYRRQIVILLLGVTVPWIGNILFNFGLTPWPMPVDLTSFAFAVTGLVLALGLFRFQLLDILPVARETVVEDLHDAVIVLDVQGRIVDLNHAARDIVGFAPGDPLGRLVEETLPWWPVLSGGRPDPLEISFGQGENRRYFDLNFSELKDRRGRLVGQVVVLRDVTDRKRTERALRESEEKYRQLFNHAPAGIYEIDYRNGHLLDFNDVILEYLGYTEEELLAASSLDILSPESQIQFSERVEKILNGEIVDSSPEFTIVAKDGRQFDVVLNTRLIYEDDKPIGATVVVHDITERKRTEGALREWEEKYRTLVTHSNDSIIVTQGSKIVFYNPRTVEITGFSIEELRNINIFDLIHEDDRARTMALSEKFMKGEEPVGNYDLRIFDKQGRLHWTRSHSVLIDWEGRKALLTFSSDITNQKEIEEALRESELKYRTLVDNIQDGVYIIQDLAFQFVNNALADMLGYSADEVVGRNFGDYIVPEDRALVLDRHQRRKSGEAVPDEYEIRIQTKDGTRKLIKVTVGQVSYRAGLANIGTIRDITDLRRAEEEKERLQTQLQQSQKMQAVGTLASGIAHDFNNILQAVSGYVEILQNRHGHQPKTAEYLTEVDHAVRRAGELVNRLLTFSRKVETDLKLVDINESVRQAVKILERTIPKMIRIEANLAEDIHPIMADPTQLEQVMLNLGTNSKDAMPEGGILTLSTENAVLSEKFCRAHYNLTPGRYVLLSFTDTGHGMDLEVMEHLFEPFFTTKGVGEGTGLGLFIVYGIVKAHKGLVTCRSRPGQTTFQVYFPAAEVERPAAESLDQTPPKTPRGHETVLVVDDEKSILATATDILEDYGYQAATATSGEEALEMYNSPGANFDLVILDLGMPGMGGWRCLEKLIKINPEVKVIVASGYSENGQSDKILAAGAKAFLNKPYRLADLLAKVRELLDEK